MLASIELAPDDDLVVVEYHRIVRASNYYRHRCTVALLALMSVVLFADAQFTQPRAPIARKGIALVTSYDSKPRMASCRKSLIRHQMIQQTTQQTYP